MANKSVFKSIASSLFGALSQSTEAETVRKTDTKNNAGGNAYALYSKPALAQFAMTGCFNSTFYASGESQLKVVLQLAKDVEPEFLAKVALISRQQAYMKDMPALLVAVLAVRSPGLMAEVFDRVIDSPKMLRNFVQIMRSGVVGRKSLGSLSKRMVQQWIEQRTETQLFRGSIGANPSLGDIIKLAHPKPAIQQRAALYAYLMKKPVETSQLPKLVQEYEAFKAFSLDLEPADMPNVPMDMFTHLPLTQAQWAVLAQKATWQQLRMNLNTFTRHRVFEDEKVLREACAKLRNAGEIQQSRAMPYQLMAAYCNADGSVPRALKDALHDAMEIATSNVPEFAGQVWVCPDVSGSMHSPITGERKGSSSKVRCVDVAALVAASVLRKNPTAGVIPFTEAPVSVNIEPRDTVLTNAKRLASLPAGGTNCSAPLSYLNQRQLRADLVILVSDNESWVDSVGVTGQRATGVMTQWEALKRRNPYAKLVCIDLQPNATTQAHSRKDILNVGGFSDNVFDTIHVFSMGDRDSDHWVRVIEEVNL